MVNLPFENASLRLYVCIVIETKQNNLYEYSAGKRCEDGEKYHR